MKLRLEIEVELEDDEDPSAEIEDQRQEIDAQLLSIADNAAANGLMTGNLPIVVETWEARVVRLE